jgi:hypothetical protein
MNRCLRRRSAAGTCLSSTSSYREHFSGQFTNSFGAEQFQETTVALDQATEIGFAAQTFSRFLDLLQARPLVLVEYLRNSCIL